MGEKIWNLVVAGGAMVGGFVFTHYLFPNQTIDISDETIQSLKEVNIHVIKGQVPLLPKEIFNWENLFTL